MADLITQQYLAAALADLGLSTNALANLPAVAAAASRLVRDWCNRQFTRATRDELLTIDPRRPIYLREFPVNAITRVSINPTAVLTVTNTATSTNQRAMAQLATSGSADAGLAVSGLTLTRIASGVAAGASLPFSTSVTVQALAAAIAALGGGWAATVASGYGAWPTADLRAVQGATPALAPGAADLRIHVEDVAFTLDERDWSLTLGDYDGDAFASPRWGPTFSADDGDQRIRPGPNNLRVVYDAGFDAIPESIQDATVEVAKVMLARWSTDGVLSGESDGTYRWQAREVIGSIPDSARQSLALYRVSRA